MRKIEGRPVNGSEFFALLSADSEFCAQLGRAMLTAGRLETELKRYLNARFPALKTEHANLGRLLKLAKEHGLLEKMQPSLELLRDQRNYLAHSIHALLSGWIEETILEKADLLDSDVSTYCDRAWQLTENLNGLAHIVGKKNSPHTQALQPPRATKRKINSGAAKRCGRN